LSNIATRAKLAIRMSQRDMSGSSLLTQSCRSYARVITV
jgi:hypothetical protein